MKRAGIEKGLAAEILDIVDLLEQNEVIDVK